VGEWDVAEGRRRRRDARCGGAARPRASPARRRSRTRCRRRSRSRLRGAYRARADGKRSPSSSARRIPDVSSTVPALVPSELVLGRYRPLRPLGSGGSGSVWLARDEQNGLDVALKIVAREGKQASRAEREAAAAARLRHERCLRAYAFESDSRNVYIAYEYVPG